MSALASRRMRPALAGVLVPVVAAADEAGYVLVLREQGGPADSRVFFVAGFIALLAVLGLAGVLMSRPAARAIYTFTAAGGLVLGFLGIFSIGLPLLAVGALSLYALARVVGRPRTSVMLASAAAALLVLLVGFMTTSLP